MKIEHWTTCPYCSASWEDAEIENLQEEIAELRAVLALWRALEPAVQAIDHYPLEYSPEVQALIKAGEWQGSDEWHRSKELISREEQS